MKQQTRYQILQATGKFYVLAQHLPFYKVNTKASLNLSANQVVIFGARVQEQTARWERRISRKRKQEMLFKKKKPVIMLSFTVVFTWLNKICWVLRKISASFFFIWHTASRQACERLSLPWWFWLLLKGFICSGQDLRESTANDPFIVGFLAGLLHCIWPHHSEYLGA